MKRRHFWGTALAVFFVVFAVALAGCNGTGSPGGSGGTGGGGGGLPTLTGTVSINNTSPTVGSTLTASFTGNGTGSATWQWLRGAAVISGANSSSYTISSADVGNTISARVSFSDQTGSITSSPTAVVGPGGGGGLPALTGTVSINNTSPTVGSTLTASFAGNGTGSATWQWLRGATVISGANSSTYTVASADIGNTISARVSFSGQTGSITSLPTAVVGGGGATGISITVTGIPTASNSRLVGIQLSNPPNTAVFSAVGTLAANSNQVTVTGFPVNTPTGSFEVRFFTGSNVSPGFDVITTARRNISPGSNTIPWSAFRTW